MKILSLDQNWQFLRLYRKGKSVVTSTMVVYVAPNHVGTPRLGITAGKKLGGAVARNRAKRRLRELYRLAQNSIKPNLDVCIVARAYTITAPYEKLENDFYSSMKKLGALFDEENID